MEKATIESKIRIEADVASLKREHKTVIRELEIKKQELADILNSIDRNKDLLDGYKADLTEILNDIAKAKLTWAEEKEQNMQELALERKKIEEKLEEVKKYEKEREKAENLLEKNAQILAENKQEILTIKEQEKQLTAQNKALEEQRVALAKEAKALEDHKEHFKSTLTKLVEDYG